MQIYDLYVKHETIRVSVLHVIENGEKMMIPEDLLQIMKKTFMIYYDSYIQTCDDNMKHDSESYVVSLIFS